MLKQYLPIVILFAIIGCGKERIVDIATPNDIYQKDLLVVFPSIPEEFCYADKMTEIMDGFSDELNLTNMQMLSVDSAVNCGSYGFTNCEIVTTESEDKSGAIACMSEQNSSRVCLYMLGVEYKDSEGDTFDESCIMGADRR
ncbi:hypothetical protein MNB_SV-6-644 [hydrothermal vent metagenome]|uniref:Lipoprotein n=1 Tax=hydrothermal vent metagenome TaxID=652676 RepID=A0A1W1BQ62_9ZZZZ